MLNRLLPRQIHHTYHGYTLALWLFAVVVFMKVTISLNSIFNGYMVASRGDGIPLDTFTPAGAQASHSPAHKPRRFWRASRSKARNSSR